jgi:hypothetical protein
VSILVWPVQPRLWLTLRWWITRLRTVFVLCAFTAWDRGVDPLSCTWWRWPRTAMTFPSIAPRRWRSMSLSASESLVRCELAREGWNGRRASPHPPDYWLGKTLRRGSDDSSNGWMTLQLCKWNCKHPSTPRLAWCMTSSVTSGLTLTLKSLQDLSLGEMSGAQVWVLTCLVPFPAFPVILSLVSLVLPLSWLLEWIASNS